MWSPSGRSVVADTAAGDTDTGEPTDTGMVDTGVEPAPVDMDVRYATEIQPNWDAIEAYYGCAACHSGPHFTDGQLHAIDGPPTATPTLVGISASPPYMHNGYARTLEEVLEWYSDVGVMGDTSQLTDADREALLAYLRSL